MYSFCLNTTSLFSGSFRIFNTVIWTMRWSRAPVMKLLGILCFVVLFDNEWLPTFPWAIELNLSLISVQVIKKKKNLPAYSVNKWRVFDFLFIVWDSGILVVILNSGGNMSAFVIRGCYCLTKLEQSDQELTPLGLSIDCLKSVTE